MQKAVRNSIRLVIAGGAIVIAIAGTWILLATFAYTGYAERAHRTEALNAMYRMLTAQEQFRLRNRTYTNDLAALGFDDGCTENCVYLVSLDVPPNAETYTARFVPNPAGGTNGVNQTGDQDCQSFTIDAIGRRSAPNRNCLEGR
jgi:Tfp pilus assembly protein PilE